MINKLIPILISIVMIFALIGCNNTKKSNKTDNGLPAEVSGTLTDSNLTVGKDGVSITVEDGSIMDDTKVNISLSKDLPPIVAEEEEINLTVYDFTVDGETPMGIMEIGIPIDAKKEEVFAAYYNPETKKWEPVEFSYDSKTKSVTIQTTHLSSYGVFTIKNEGLRTAMLAYSSHYLDMGDMDLEEAIRLLEGAQYNTDSFYEDSLGLISQSLSIQDSISGNAVDVLSGLTTYVPTFSEGVKNSIKYAGIVTAGIQLIDATINDEDKYEPVWRMIESGAGFWLDKAASQIGTASVSAGLFSVGLINYAINEFYQTALEGRTDIYEKAYNLYYKEKGRKTADWNRVIRDIVNKGKNPQETGNAINEEIHRYVYEFWEDQTIVGEYGQSANKDAWSTGSLGGLNEGIKKDISEYNRSVIEKIVAIVLKRIQIENKINMQTDLRKAINEFQTQMNQVVTIELSDSKAGVKDSEFAGYTVRPANLSSNIKDKEKWEAVLDDKGNGKIRFRVFAHLSAGAPNSLELVKLENDEETVVQTIPLKLSIPKTAIDIAIDDDISGVYDITNLGNSKTGELTVKLNGEKITITSDGELLSGTYDKESRTVKLKVNEDSQMGIKYVFGKNTIEGYMFGPHHETGEYVESEVLVKGTKREPSK